MLKIRQHRNLHIKDANFAQETSKLTKAQILNQAATSMLAQANAFKTNSISIITKLINLILNKKEPSFEGFFFGGKLLTYLKSSKTVCIDLLA